MSTVYHAPLTDIEFLLLQVLRIDALGSLPKFVHLDADAVRTVLAQGARFAEAVDEQIPFLLRKAERLDEYLRQR